MKKILITGIDSYIGTSFEKWVSKWPNKYIVESIDVRDHEWKSVSFQGFDVVCHIAAIVHVKENNKAKYYKVNRDLVIDIAKKAKEDGIQQFIFLSTMGVYGIETGYINDETVPCPRTHYAKSKLEAEKLLLRIEEDTFKVAIIRSPIVYGKGCRGNYPRLADIVLKLPIFPLVKNERSMIYVDNLSEFIRLMIDFNVGGLYFPQNKDYVNITELALLIAMFNEKDLKTIKKFNFAVNLGMKISGTFRKVFGSFYYDKKMLGGPGTKINGHTIDYETVSFEESIKQTEKKNMG